MLFVGDAATDFARLDVGPVYEDIDEGMRSLRRLADLPFETAPSRTADPLAAGGGALPRAVLARLTRRVWLIAPAARRRRGGDAALNLPKNHSLTPAHRVVS